MLKHTYGNHGISKCFRSSGGTGITFLMGPYVATAGRLLLNAADVLAVLKQFCLNLTSLLDNIGIS